VVWHGQPDAIANAIMWRFLWWIGFPWLLLTVIAVSNDWIDQATQPLAMIGVGMIAAPFVMLLQDLQTLYVITDRRALIVRTAWSRRSVTATSFDAMDEVFEILDIGGGVGHLNFASGRSTRSPDTDYTGRYGFRCVRDAPRIRDILDHARRTREELRLPRVLQGAKLKIVALVRTHPDFPDSRKSLQVIPACFRGSTS